LILILNFNFNFNFINFIFKLYFIYFNKQVITTRHSVTHYVRR